MKGAMSSPDQVAIRSLLHSLYPSTPYRFNSGGDPEKIPELTHEQLVAFHRRHYHPSNAYFFTYGDLALDAHLAFIQDRILHRFSRIDPQTEVPPQPRWTEPREARYRYPIRRTEDPSKKHQVSLAWLTAEITDASSVLVLSLLEQVLLANAASPLRRALIESGMGSSLSDGTGYSDEYRDTLFAAGLKDVEKSAVPAVEALIVDTLRDLARNGVEPEMVASAIHQIEFSRKEKTNQPYPYGLKLLLQMIGPWLHGGDPVRTIEIEEDLDRIRKKHEAGGFFESQISTRLIDNPHRVRFLLEPDPELEETASAREAADLEEIFQSLDPERRAAIEAEAHALQQRQEKAEDVSVLPTLTVADISPEVRPDPESRAPVATSAVVYDRPTGGIFYLSAAAGIGTVARDRLPLLPFLCYALPKMGTARKNYTEVARKIDLYTGGFSLSASARTRFGPSGACVPFVAVNTKCLFRNLSPMFEVLEELLVEPDFGDIGRLRTLLLEYRANFESMVVHNGHRLAISLAARNFSPAAALSEIWGGVHQLRFIKAQGEALSDPDARRLSENLAELAAAIFTRDNLSMALIGEDPALAEGISAASAMASALAPGTSSGFSLPETLQADFTPREGWSTSSAVSFVARAFPTVRFDHEDAAPLTVLAKMLRSLYLHREIREKGGAYGGMSLYNAEDGIFCLASYRDPHILRTLHVYDGVADFIGEQSITPADIDEAKLQVCSDIDRPDPPGPAARKAFYRKLIGLTDEERTRFKQRVLSVTRSQILGAARTLFSEGSSRAGVAVISGEEQLQSANEQMGDTPLFLQRI
jgi:Zn-dependent M16 (insulinase) family peptidase